MNILNLFKGKSSQLYIYDNSETMFEIGVILECEWKYNHFTRCRPEGLQPLNITIEDVHYKYLFTVDNGFLPGNHIWLSYIKTDEDEIQDVKLAVSDINMDKFKRYSMSHIQRSEVKVVGNEIQVDFPYARRALGLWSTFQI